MMTGHIEFKNKEYTFWFEEDILELVPVKASKTVSFEAIEEFFSDNYRLEIPEMLQGISTYSRNVIIFFIKDMDRHNDNYQFKVYAFIEFKDGVEPVNKISFAFEELNWFYNIRKAYGYEFNHGTGEMNVTIDPFDSLSKEFSFLYDGKTIQALLNVSRTISNESTNPVTLNSDLSFAFEICTDLQFYLKLYNLTRRFFRLVTYRQNINISKILLKKKDNSSGKYFTIGTFKFIENKDQFKETEKRIKERMIDFDIINSNCSNLFQLLIEDKIYLEHIPYNSKDMNRITPARFILITAAFEWEFRNFYGNVKTAENEDFRVVRDKLDSFINSLIQGNSGKQKSYAKYYKKIVNSIDMNLAERILRALNDFHEITGKFIENLFHINGIKDFKYSQIAERLQTQRNNYAHGNLDRTIDSIVILDLVALEWIIYAMILKNADMSDLQIKKSINKLFGRRFCVE